ncbi:MAG: hypothetical protein DPW21_11795 [Anaerolineae bacterium]|nr:hypothetical protein [Anaerolineae bacterium]
MPVNTKFMNLLLILGTACFLIGAPVSLLGLLETPLNFILPALGLILIGAGAAGRRKPIRKKQ